MMCTTGYYKMSQRFVPWDLRGTGKVTVFRSKLTCKFLSPMVLKKQCARTAVMAARHSAGTRAQAQLHLVTDVGFARSAMLWLLVEAALLLAAYAHAPLRHWAEDIYEDAKLQMLGAAQ